MSDHKITDFVDQSAIDGLKRLKDELTSAKETYIQVANELVKGLKVPIDNLEQLEKMTKEFEELQRKGAEASRKHAAAIAEHERICASTTNTISRQLMEQERANKAQRDTYAEGERVKKLLEQANGTYEDHVKALIDVNENLKRNKKAQDDNDAALKRGSVSVQAHSERLLNLTKEQRDLAQQKHALTTLLKNEERLNNAVEGSYAHLSQQLELLKKAYKSMTDEEKQSPMGKDMEESIQNLDAHLKDLAADMGEFQRNTGNYAVAGQSVRKELKAMVVEIANLTVAYNRMSDEEKASAQGQEMKRHITELTEQAGELRGAVADTTRAINNAASDTRGFDQISGGIKLLIDGFGLATGAAEMLGLSDKDLMEVQTKLQAALVASNSLTSIQAALQKHSAVMQGVNILQTKAATIAENLKTAAVGRGVVATKAATLAQKAFNLVAKANPYVLLATVIGGVAAAYIGLSKSTKKYTSVSGDAARAIKRHNEAMRQQAEIVKGLSGIISSGIAEAMQKWVDYQRSLYDIQSKMEGPETDAIARLRVLYSVATDNTKSTQARLKAAGDMQSMYPSYLGNLSKEKIIAGEAAGAYMLLCDNLEKAAKARAIYELMAENSKKMMYEQSQTGIDLNSVYQLYDLAMKNFIQSSSEVMGENADEFQKLMYKAAIMGTDMLTDEQSKRFNELYKEYDQLTESADHYLNVISDTYDLMGRNYLEAAMANKRLLELFHPEDLINETNKSIASSVQSTATATKQTIADTLAQIQRLSSDAEAMLIGTLDEGTEEWAAHRQKQIDDTQQAELTALGASAAKTLAALKNSLAAKEISQAQFEAYVIKLQEATAAKENAIYAKTAADYDKMIESMSASAIKGAEERAAVAQIEADNEYNGAQAALKKKLAAQLSAVKSAEDIAAAQAEYDRESAALSEQYAQDTLNRQIEMLERLLEDEELTETDREELARRLAKAKTDAANAAADAEIKSANDAADAEIAAREKTLAKMKEWGKNAMDILNGVNALSQAIYAAKVERVEAEQEANEEAGDKEAERIQSLVDHQVITEEEGEARKRAAEEATARKNEELEKKKAALKRKAAIFDKAAAIANVGMNTALALMQLWVKPGWPTAIPMQPVVSALGAMQLATILATPIPKYAKGTKDHPGGVAVVGDGGRHEVVAFDGHMFLTPDRPTIIDMPKGAEVFPDATLVPDALNLPDPSLMEVRPSSVVVSNDYTCLVREVRQLQYLIKQQTKAQARAVNREKFEAYKRMKGL